MGNKKEGIGQRLLNLIPHPLAILVIFVFLGALASYILPAGAYNRQMDPAIGKIIVESGSYHEIERTPVSIAEAVKCLPEGCAGVASIVFFVILMGGGFGILEATGALKAGIDQILKKYSSKRILIVVAMTVLLSICSSTFGMSAEMLAFTPFLITMSIGLGYDALVGVAIPVIGMISGFGAAAIGPYTVRIAQELAQLPALSGIMYRLIFWVVVVTICVVYLISYCNRIYKAPSESLVSQIDYSDIENSNSELSDITKTQMTVLGIFAVSIALLIIGCIKWQFTFDEIASLFLGMGIVSGLVARMSLNDICEYFLNGARKMVFAALAVGFANAIMVVFTKGNILDTIINGMVSLLQGTGLPAIVTAVLLVPIQSIINLFIPSGSGQAIAIMPIMIPVADLLGINRQVAILTFQIGNGFANVIVPTLGLLMAHLAMGRIPYGIWFKFIYKLFLLLIAVGMVFVAVAVKLNYGPF